MKSVGGANDPANFWDGNIPAPLKRAIGQHPAHPLRNFWDGNIPAPLKLDGLEGGIVEHPAFLGWKHPGPIEAWECARLLLGRLDFWDGNIPAPLKPHRRPRRQDVQATFLGWKHPGPIEAG